MLGRKVLYVICIYCSYNNVAKGIGLLEKKAFFVYMQVRAFERYIPFMLIKTWHEAHIIFHEVMCNRTRGYKILFVLNSTEHEIYHCS